MLLPAILMGIDQYGIYFLVTALKQAVKSVEVERSQISSRNTQVVDLSNASELVRARASAVLMSVVQASIYGS